MARGLGGLIGVGRVQKEQALAGLTRAAQLETQQETIERTLEAQKKAAQMNVVGTAGGIGTAALLTKGATTTAAGGAAIIFPFLLIVWAILWVIFYLMRKNILFSNIAATVLSLLLVYNIADVAVKYTHPKTDDVSSLIFVSTSVMVLIFTKHIDPLKEFIIEQKMKRVIKK